jgi:WD40 repeat protein
VLGLGDDSAFIWDFADPKAESPPLKDRPKMRREEAGAAKDQQWPAAYATSPDGRHLAVGYNGSLDRQRDFDLFALHPGRPVTDLRVVRSVGPQPGGCYAILYSADGKSVVAVSEENTSKTNHLAVYDAGTGAARRSITIPPPHSQGNLVAVAVAADARMAAVGLSDGTTRLWDLTTGAELPRLTGHVGETPSAKGVGAVAFSTDGRSVLTAGWDGWVRCWDPTTGRETRPAVRTAGRPHTVVWARDGKKAAVAGQGGLIQVWDVESGTGPPLDRLGIGRHGRRQHGGDPRLGRLDPTVESSQPDVAPSDRTDRTLRRSTSPDARPKRRPDQRRGSVSRSRPAVRSRFNAAGGVGACSRSSVRLFR